MILLQLCLRNAHEYKQTSNFFRCVDSVLKACKYSFTIVCHSCMFRDSTKNKFRLANVIKLFVLAMDTRLIDSIFLKVKNNKKKRFMCKSHNE